MSKLEISVRFDKIHEGLNRGTVYWELPLDEAISDLEKHAELYREVRDDSPFPDEVYVGLANHGVVDMHYRKPIEAPLQDGLDMIGYFSGLDSEIEIVGMSVFADREYLPMIEEYLNERQKTLMPVIEKMRFETKNPMYLLVQFLNNHLLAPIANQSKYGTAVRDMQSL